MLLCGFEKFDKFFVRIDILERLFIKIINSSQMNKNEIKLIPEMLNLLGCSKENFLKLIKIMSYKTYEKKNEIFFKYSPVKKYKKKTQYKNSQEDNPFNILTKIATK